MITSRTKAQLVIFVVITLLGMSYVGARYARLNRLFYDTTYQVNAQFAQSGGIFTGAEVTYRGVGIGQVSDMKLTKSGVDVVLSIDKSSKKIPSNTLALVGNKSAVGEQYVELQPKTDGAPYLHDNSTIATPETSTPVSTTELLTNLDALVNSVPQPALRTSVTELGNAFKGTGPSLAQIIDTSTSFIKTADQNFDVTTALIRDSNTVLRTQVDKGSDIRSFARDLDLFSGTLAGHDADLRKLIDNGSASIGELRSFLAENQVNLGSLINNLVTTGEITVRRIPGLRQILVLYPYLVAGAFGVLVKSPDGGQDASFGLVLTNNPPVCHQGYESTDRRSPQDRANRPMVMDAHCSEPASQSNARGAQNAPRTAPRVDTARAGSPVATYDQASGKLTWTDQDKTGAVVPDGAEAAQYREDPFTWMLLRPTLETGPEE